MVYTADIRVGAVKISMNTNWADDYIHDCLRYERGEDTDECELYELYTMIENELDNRLDSVVRWDENFDTYDFFEGVIGNNVYIMRKMERVLVEVEDEEEEEEMPQELKDKLDKELVEKYPDYKEVLEKKNKQKLEEAFERVATEMCGGMAKVSVNF